MEATLITGEPELRGPSPFTLSANTTIHTVPTGIVSVVRIEGPPTLFKTSMWDMDQMIPNWQNDVAPVANDRPTHWFPIGLTRFGIYPKLNAPAQVFLDYMALPITDARPYAGTENIPFQAEYEEGFTDYAAHIARLKEGGEGFIGSMAALDRFNEKMIELSKFGYRKGALRFTRAMGAPAKVTEVEER